MRRNATLTTAFLWSILCIVANLAPARAQQSAGYTLEQPVINQGGAPDSGAQPSSLSYSLSQVSIGDSLAPQRLSGGIYSADVGFGATFAPPGETEDLRFTGFATLAWDPEPAAHYYRLYRDDLANLGAGAFGSCLQTRIDALVTVDSDVPANGAGFTYLVVAVNRLDEAGPLGADSDGVRRDEGPCP